MAEAVVGRKSGRASARLDWAKAWPRAAILAAALGLAAVVVRQELKIAIGRSDPAAAAALAPSDSVAAMSAARAAVTAGAKPDSPRVRRLVDAALSRDVSQPPAIELKALALDAAGEHRRAERLFDLSTTLSRRSLPTHLWRIQHAVDKGDVAGALGEFDTALRTSTAAPPILFPVLTRALSDPSLTPRLAALLDRPSDWRIPFLNEAITKRHAGVGAAAVVLAMRDRRGLAEGQIDEVLTGELIAEEEFALARRTHDVFHGRTPDLMRDPGFADPSAGPPFGWRLIETGDAGAVRASIGGRSALSFQSVPGGRGAAAVQLLTLTPGRYRLSTRTAEAPADAAARPYWTLTCAETGGAQIALLEQPTDIESTAAAEVLVPASCSAQWLVLNLRPSDTNQTGAIAWIAVKALAGPGERSGSGRED